MDAYQDHCYGGLVTGYAVQRQLVRSRNTRPAVYAEYSVKGAKRAGGGPCMLTSSNTHQRDFEGGTVGTLKAAAISVSLEEDRPVIGIYTKAQRLEKIRRFQVH